MTRPEASLCKACPTRGVKHVPPAADPISVGPRSAVHARFPGPGYSAYAAARGAVEVLTRHQAAELGDRPIRVNPLVPGAIATDFGGGVVRDVEQVNAALAGAIALRRVGAADDIGATVPALPSGALGWADGTRFESSGGQNL